MVPVHGGLASRDRWIGWSDNQRQIALPRVVAQVRFLILPWIRCPNLASKLLSLSATQLPTDWEHRYEIRPWLLESFVDASRYDGSLLPSRQLDQRRNKPKAEAKRIAIATAPGCPENKSTSIHSVPTT